LYSIILQYIIFIITFITYDLKLLLKKINISEVILSPEDCAKITPQELTSELTSKQ